MDVEKVPSVKHWESARQLVSSEPPTPDDVPTTLRPRLPAGYRSAGVEVTVKGQCKSCVRPAPRRVRR